jgi:hypothetical protein
MSCENCEEEKKQELLSDQFGQELAELLEKYRGELNSFEIAYGLVLEAKIEMCCVSTCFIHMYGTLMHMMGYELEKMHNEMKPTEEEKNNE